jgi:hypothetical protein
MKLDGTEVTLHKSISKDLRVLKDPMPLIEDIKQMNLLITYQEKGMPPRVNLEQLLEETTELTSFVSFRASLETSARYTSPLLVRKLAGFQPKPLDTSLSSSSKKEPESLPQLMCFGLILNPAVDSPLWWLYCYFRLPFIIAP